MKEPNEALAPEAPPGTPEANLSGPAKPEKSPLLREVRSLAVRLAVFAAVLWVLLTQVYLVTQASGSEMFPAVKDGDLVHVKSRFGEFDIKASTAGRTEPQEGIVFAPFFAEETLVNLAVQDTYCPLSKEPDYKKTCVSITKVEG